MVETNGQSPTGGFIDLHSHTNESDGTLAPGELVSLAKRIGLRALAITDHDTFRGYEQALPFAHQAGLDLVCGIELNGRMAPGTKRSVHILAYFPNTGPTPAFTHWLARECASRRDRNQRLAENLQREGLSISLAEVEQRGKSLTGRPHFARVLIDKGYVDSFEQAFDKYLGEQAPSFVPRQSRTAEEVIGAVRDSDGVPVVAHPIRLGLPRAEEKQLLLRYRDAGLAGLEIYHSEHTPELQAYYRQLAEELGLVPTGGSDFHGDIKPLVSLGTGLQGNVRVPSEFLLRLRSLQPA